MVQTVVIDLEGLQALIEALLARGYTVIGPTVQRGVIVNAPVHSVSDLPVGWGEEQEAGRYRLQRRADDAVFGFAAGPHSAKQVFFPAEQVLWRGRRQQEDFSLTPPEPDPDRPYALLGLRSCDLAAVAVHDTVLAGRGFTDADYQARRAGSFVVAVTCTDPGGTCFCSSMGGGPRPATSAAGGYDLALTELLEESAHRFLVQVGTDAGAELLEQLTTAQACDADLAAADLVEQRSAASMGRTVDTDGLKELLYAAADSPSWAEVASRCLSCTSCTAVCPTCFCTTVQDVTDLGGDQGDRHRVWDSCFTTDFSSLHGGAVRRSTSSRYRQWMTHKLASWVDQFGTSGCVGCGRCITWCPVGIDITAQVGVLRAEQAPPGPAR